MNYVAPQKIAQDISPEDLDGVKVTFINMPIREQAKPNVAPLGPTLLASRLLHYGAEVTIVDLNAYRIEDEAAKKRRLPNGRTLSFIESEELLGRTFAQVGDQDLIGISGLITTLKWQIEVAKMVRRLQPQTLLVSGGGLATEFRSGLFDWIPELDGVAHSEGDDIILKIAFDAKLIRNQGIESAEYSGKLMPYLRGVVDSRPRFIYDGGRPVNLDNLPYPAFDLMQTDVDGALILERYIQTPVWGTSAVNSSATSFEINRNIATISSRGCPFACRFCFRGAQGERNYGVKSATSLANEMVYYVEKYNVDFVAIVDDNFMVQPERIFDLVPHLKPVVEEYGLSWGTHGRLDEAADLRPGSSTCEPTIADRLRVEAMYQAGCRYIGFGAESASPHVLDEMGKGGFMLSNGTVSKNGFEFPRTMVHGIVNTKNSGIHANCTWIMGYPGESLHDLQTSVAFIKWQIENATYGLTPGSEAHDAAAGSINQNMFTATAYPGTEMFDEPRVRELLTERFGLHFDRVTGTPISDENFLNYVLELNDATKMLVSEDNRPLNFGAIPDDKFIEARNLVDNHQLFEILDM